jgi:hypothetical protein
VLSESMVLFGTGGAGLLFGLAALAAGVQGVAAVLCSFVFALAALCLFTGWRYWSQSPLRHYRLRELRKRAADSSVDIRTNGR